MFSIYGWSVASGLTVKIGIVQDLRVQDLRVQRLKSHKRFAKLFQTVRYRGIEVSVMSDLDNLDFDFNVDGAETTSFTEKHQAVFNVDARRHVEERLEASRVQKQTQDYDFDLD
jgi:hypothetical protein